MQARRERQQLYQIFRKFAALHSPLLFFRKKLDLPDGAI
jgi:hypothetical protein